MNEKPLCKWNIEELMVYLEARIDATASHVGARIDASEKLNIERFESLKSSIGAAMAAADRAVSKAETAAEKRFESVNEFRNTLSDQQRNLIPRAEFDALEKALSFRLNAIDTQLSEQRAERVGIKGGWGYAAGVAGLIVALLAIASALNVWTRP